MSSSNDDPSRQRLQASEERLRLVVEAAPSGMIMVDDVGKIVLVNSQVETLFGYGREELLGQAIELLVPISARSKHPGYRDAFFAEPKARSMGVGRDLFGLRKDGTQVPVEIGLNPLITEGKRFVLASVVDITERKRSEERLRLVIETAPSGMIMVDDEGKIVLVNSQVEKLFGYSREELLGQAIEMLVPPSARSQHPGYRNAFFAESKARSMGAGRDLFGLRKDGSMVPVEIGLNPLLTEGKRFVLASVVDITERQKSAEMLQEKLKELQRSNDELQQFAYVCSHDLQEPLRVIANYTQLLEKRYSNALDDKAHQFIGFTVDATKRMQELINDLLTFSRVDTRAEAFVAIDSSVVANQALANLRVAVQDSDADIRIGELPSLLADSSQLLQLFQNLIGNAIKFRSGVRPVIEISAQELANSWVFSVRDNGLGIDMKHAERIFVIFQRLHTKEEYPGSGIGLAICKKIVERHGGEIRLESEPGKGSCFYFTMPKHKSPPRGDI